MCCGALEVTNAPSIYMCGELIHHRRSRSPPQSEVTQGLSQMPGQSAHVLLVKRFKRESGKLVRKTDGAPSLQCRAVESLLKLTGEVCKMAVVDVTFTFSLRAMGRNQCDASVSV